MDKNMTSGKNTLLVSYKQAADILGVCERTVQNLVYTGRLAFVKIGRTTRIRISELERFVDDCSCVNIGGEK